jgi:predicted small metal-binding protein
MKTITCREMGGMCDTPISAETKEEMIQKGMEHVEEAHPEMAANIKAMAKDDPKMIEWSQNFDKTWEMAEEN